MLYNVIKQQNTNNILAIPADEGLADIAFQEGWRILIPAQADRMISKSIERREAWEWGIYLHDLSSDDAYLMADDPRFTPYVEDVSDEYESDTDILDNDGDSPDEPTEASYDYEETFHHLNQQ
jgi:hypothetical protein